MKIRKRQPTVIQDVLLPENATASLSASNVTGAHHEIDFLRGRVFSRDNQQGEPAKDGVYNDESTSIMRIKGPVDTGVQFTLGNSNGSKASETVRGTELEDMEISEGVTKIRRLTTGSPNMSPVPDLNEEGDANHPANKPKESLLYSLYSVFSRLSGTSVLSAREALSRVIDEGLPGLDEQLGVPSVQVAKVMRSNPYFVQLDGGKYFMCSGPSLTGIGGLTTSIVVDEESLQAIPRQAHGIKFCGKREREEKDRAVPDESDKLIDHLTSLSTNASRGNNVASKASSRPRLACQKPSSHETTLTDGVRICKRYDGRGWKCQEEALDGYSMCRHHHELIVARLARLRSSGRLGSKKPSKQQRRSYGHKQIENERSKIEPDRAVTENGLEWRKNVKARSLKSIH